MVGSTSRAQAAACVALIASFHFGTARADGDADAQASMLATVNVTGERKSLDDAASIDVLDATAVANTQLRELEQLQDQIANLRIASEGGRASPWFVSLRGFVNPFGAPNSAAALTVDGVPMTDFYSFDQHLFDVERIVVRKGPQGSIYGANSESGTIEIVTRKPDANAHAFGEASFASRGTYDAGAGLSGAIGANVYASLAAARDGSDGYLDNLAGQRPYNGSHGSNLRGRLVWNAVERVELDAMLLHHRIDDHGGETYLPVDRASFNALPTLGGLKLGKFDQALSDEGGSHARSTLVALQGTWNGEGGQVRALTSYRSRDARNASDYDLSPLPWFVMDAHYRVRESYAELRAQSAEAIDARTSWLAGVSADHRDTDFLRLFQVDATGNSFGFPIGVYPRANDALADRSVALFGQATQRFGAARNFGLAFGARAERAQHELDFRGNALDPSPAHALRSDAQFLPKLTLDYRFALMQTAYFSVARGWQPGGFNTTAFASAHAQYRPEVTTAYESGFKGELVADASYSLVAFRNDIRDYQDLIFSATQLESYIANASRARTQGLEAQFAWKPAVAWQLGATLGSVRAVYTDDAVGAAGLRLDGRSLGQVPHSNYNLHLQYAQGMWLARVELAGASSFAVHDHDETSNVLREQNVPGYAILNAKLGWHDTHWSAYLFGHNLTDRRYFTSATFGFGAVALYTHAVGIVAPPRTLGIGLRWEQ